MFDIQSDFTEYKRVFLQENSKHNLISKNDEKFLYEKHIYDSLAIKLFFEKYGTDAANLLDIGCGGGFPCVPIAMEYPALNVTGLDSIGKKINAVNVIKETLNLKNLTALCCRAENLRGRTFDIITCRAVADLGKICAYALPLLNKNGYLIAYKSKKAREETETAKPVLKNFRAEVKDILSYTLPADEVYERNLIVISWI